MNEILPSIAMGLLGLWTSIRFPGKSGWIVIAMLVLAYTLGLLVGMRIKLGIP